MMFKGLLFFIISVGSAVASVHLKGTNQKEDTRTTTRQLQGTSRSFDLHISNLAFMQPLSPFFVMVHDDTIDPLYTLGDPASPALATLAEDGDPGPLVAAYSEAPGVLSAEAFADGAPFTVGQDVTIQVAAQGRFRYVTIASMMINTNDAFVAINSVKLRGGRALVLDQPVLDAGSEENNELCSDVPGPACGGGKGKPGNGEGVVHVHRGIHGIGNLTASVYDWRNPGLRVVIEKSY